MRLGVGQGPLSGHVEMDDTIIGGHQSRTDKRRKGTNKSVVFGMVERDGRILAGPVPESNARYVTSAVEKNVDRQELGRRLALRRASVS